MPQKSKLIILFFITAVFIFLTFQTFSQISDSLKKEINTLSNELKKDPANIDKLLKLAQRYGWAKDEPKAIETYEKVLELDPNNLTAIKALKDFYSWNDRRSDSIRMMERIIKLEPDSPDIIELKEKLAYNYMWNDRQGDAIVLFEEVVKADPSRAETRKMLADLYSWNNRQAEALKEYLQIIDTIQVPKEKVDIYNKVADRYYADQSYSRARDYYERILEIDPENQDAQLQLEAIEKRLRPRIFTRFDLYEAKGGYERWVQTIGFNKLTENDYGLSGFYRHYRRDEEGEDRYRYHNWEFQISKPLNDTLTGFAGFGIKYYEPGDRVRPEFFLSALKSYRAGRLRSLTTYSKRVMDSSEDDLGQHVDRHSLAETIYWDINKRFSLSSTLIASYYTQGTTPNNNLGLEYYFSPTLHILEEPRLDFTYTYYKVFHLRKDLSGGRDYEYYSPRRLDIHAATLYYRQDLSDHWQFILSDTVDFLDGDEFNHTMRNSGRAELAYKINEDNSIRVRYIRSNQIKNKTGADTNDDNYHRDDRLTVQLEHAF
jgi:tetratricopeptide (TPR) repeat protein